MVRNGAQPILMNLGDFVVAKLVFGMNQSLDGYVDHMAFAPSPALFRHFIKEAQGQAGTKTGSDSLLEIVSKSAV